MSTMLGVIRLSRIWPHLGAPYSTIPTSALTIAACGPVLYVHLFLAYVCLDHLLFLDDLLTQADLLLDHRTLFDHNLFLNNGYPDLVALLGHSEPFAVGPYPLANLDGSCLALASAGYELLFAPLHPDLVFGGAVGTAFGGALVPWRDQAFALYIARSGACALAGLQVDLLVAGRAGVVRAVGLPL